MPEPGHVYFGDPETGRWVDAGTVGPPPPPPIPIAQYVRGPLNGQEQVAHLSPDGRPAPEVTVRADRLDGGLEGTYRRAVTVDWRTHPVYVWASPEWPARDMPTPGEYNRFAALVDHAHRLRLELWGECLGVRSTEAAFMFVLPPAVAPGVTRFHEFPVYHAVWADVPYVAVREPK